MFFLVSIFSAQILMSETTNEIARRRPPTFWDFLLQPKFIVMLVIGLVVIVLLKTKKMRKGIKVPLLLVSTFLFGFAGNLPTGLFTSFAMHPSPMCAATKSLLYGFGLPFIVTLAVIFLLTLIGPKLFCGYVCPVGAIQELIAMLTDKLKIKRNRLNFTLAHGIRLGIFILFIFISATAILYITVEGKIYPRSFYDYINPFHGLEFGLNDTLLDYVIHYLPFVLTVIFAFKYYRPFCHFVCPIGLYAHFLEQIALFRVSFKKAACTDCKTCAQESPCTAIPEIIKESMLRPDCFACNVCVDTCPEKALRIGIKKTPA